MQPSGAPHQSLGKRLNPYACGCFPGYTESSTNKLPVLRMSNQPNSEDHDNSATHPDNLEDQENLTLAQMFGSALAAMVCRQRKAKRFCQR